MIDKTISSINTRLNYINNNSENKYILNRCMDIKIKLEELKQHSLKVTKDVDFICDSIIHTTDLMSRVLGETQMVYKKFTEIANFCNTLKTEYWEDAEESTEEEINENE